MVFEHCFYWSYFMSLNGKYHSLKQVLLKSLARPTATANKWRGCLYFSKYYTITPKPKGNGEMLIIILRPTNPLSKVPRMPIEL